MTLYDVIIDAKLTYFLNLHKVCRVVPHMKGLNEQFTIIDNMMSYDVKKRARVLQSLIALFVLALVNNWPSVVLSCPCTAIKYMFF